MRRDIDLLDKIHRCPDATLVRVAKKDYDAKAEIVGEKAVGVVLGKRMSHDASDKGHPLRTSRSSR